MATQQDKDAVYGNVFRSALQQIQLIQQAIEQQIGIGFKSKEACEQWAKEHLLDILVLGKAQKCIYHITHHGEILTKATWFDYYCKDVLFWWKDDEKKGPVAVPWIPEGLKYNDQARINGELTDGIRQPLVHRDYFTPTGYYDMSRGTFNIAKPYPVAAAQTGADTSHIYTYIDHLAGECALWLLAWLRAKMINPYAKTQVVPVIVSRVQGNGKTTFAEVICKGLFGSDNVIVSESYDAGARFNTDAADKLVICIEEKDEGDKRNQVNTLKSRATATTVRKEHKGIDPIYQDDYAEYIITTNKDVPTKFDGREDQRRFMIMDADSTFTRKTSALADEVFSKLYGKDVNDNDIGISFVQDTNTIAQFKHELFIRDDLAAIKLREFPKTAAYTRCFSLPRTSEAVEIESILRAIMPFIKASLVAEKLVTELQDPDDPSKKITLSSVINAPSALQYIPAVLGKPPLVAVCRPLTFYSIITGNPFQHAVVERSLYDAEPWLLADFNIQLLHDMAPLPGGFMNVAGRFKHAVTARFTLIYNKTNQYESATRPVVPDLVPIERVGTRLRVNNKWQPDPEGEYETLNEMKPGVTTLQNKSDNVQYMDTFLFEGDETTKAIYMIEDQRKNGSDAEAFFRERLAIQKKEADRLFKLGIAARVVYSGGKSYHIIVRVKDRPMTLEERKWLHAHLSTFISTKLTFDPVTYDPARLTRAPITKVRQFEYNGRKLQGTQRLIYENWNNVYDYNWRAQYETWQNRPLYEFEKAYGKRLVPTKEEYRDAMYALLAGTFWTDNIWNGRRQQCFFPGYRLCRYLGYDHATLWSDGGILDGVEQYYRQSEIGYWKSRESSDIIKKIDDDIDSMEVEER